MFKCPKCSKCKGEMERGVLIDHSYFSVRDLTWGTSSGVALGFGIKKERPIASYRCKKCGFLENYALD